MENRRQENGSFGTTQERKLKNGKDKSGKSHNTYEAQNRGHK